MAETNLSSLLWSVARSLTAINADRKAVTERIVQMIQGLSS